MRLEKLHNSPPILGDKKPLEKDIKAEALRWARFLYSAYEEQKIRSGKGKNEV